MGEHLVDGEFKSDKYPWCPAGFVALKLSDRDAQPFLWGYAEVHRPRDASFADDLQQALRGAGFYPPEDGSVRFLEQLRDAWPTLFVERMKWLVSREGALNPEEVVSNAERLTDLYVELASRKYRAFQAKLDALRRSVKP
jgi:hypothetical protein